MKLSRLLPTVSAVAALAGAVGSANAELVFGLTDSAAPALVSFDSASAGALSSIGSITGIVAGQTLRGIDFRPSNGLLYALSSSGSAAQLYTINTTTFAATAVGAGITLTGNSSIRISLDFNPVADALRVVTGGGQSYRVNANTGALIAQDTSLSSALLVSGVAYTNNVPGATQTTLYGYDYFSDSLLTIGSINGTPNSPNTGITTTIGASGQVAQTAGMGFDISGATGIGYISLDASSSLTAATEFYSVNLGTGALTLLGTSPTALLDISVTPVPEAPTLAMTLAGLGILAAALRRRRAA